MSSQKIKSLYTLLTKRYFCDSTKKQVIQYNPLKTKNNDITFDFSEDSDNNLSNREYRESLYSFAFKNNLDFSHEKKVYGKKIFCNSKTELVNIIGDNNINLYKQSIKNNDYFLYDKHRNVPEILVLGRSNVGKSTLINTLLNKELAKPSKRQGKTQNLEFYLMNYKKIDVGMIVDSPGFGYIDGPVILRKKFRYLIYSYINYGVRLQLILYLINGKHGMQKIDKEELEYLNRFGKQIQIVFTKLENTSRSEPIQYITEVSNFTKGLKNVRQEIFLTSARKNFGISNLRASIAFDILHNNLIGLKKLEAENNSIDL